MGNSGGGARSALRHASIGRASREEQEVRHVLVVANQTLGGDHLADAIRSRMSGEPTRFSLVVPATHRTHIVVALAEAFAVQGGMHPPTPTSDDDVDAQNRLEAGLAWIRALGADADGLVGEHDPVRAVRDFLAEQACAEIIVSTLPHGMSNWLYHNLPHRLEHGTGLPVTVITAPDPGRG
jgi:GABA permease